MNGGDYNQVFSPNHPGNLSSMNGKKEYRACPSGWEYGTDGKTCYPVCNSGYTGYDGTCYENCPAAVNGFGYSSSGTTDLTCKPVDGNGNPLGYTKPTTDATCGCGGYRDDGTSCWEDYVCTSTWNDCCVSWAWGCSGCKGL
jgi:hypothetical protein